MIREVILVEIIYGANLSTDKCKVFTSTEKADNYFKDLLKEFDITNEDDVEAYLDDGYCDFTLDTDEKVSIMIKEISFEED